MHNDEPLKWKMGISLSLSSKKKKTSGTIIKMRAQSNMRTSYTHAHTQHITRICNMSNSQTQKRLNTRLLMRRIHNQSEKKIIFFFAYYLIWSDKRSKKKEQVLCIMLFLPINGFTEDTKNEIITERFIKMVTGKAGLWRRRRRNKTKIVMNNGPHSSAKKRKFIYTAGRILLYNTTAIKLHWKKESACLFSNAKRKKKKKKDATQPSKRKTKTNEPKYTQKQK